MNVKNEKESDLPEYRQIRTIVQEAGPQKPKNTIYVGCWSPLWL